MTHPMVSEFFKNTTKKTHADYLGFIQGLEASISQEIVGLRRQKRDKVAQEILKKMDSVFQREAFLKALWDFEISLNAEAPNRAVTCFIRSVLNHMLLESNPTLRSHELKNPEDLLIKIHIPPSIRNAYRHIGFDETEKKYTFQLKMERYVAPPWQVGLLHLGQLFYYASHLISKSSELSNFLCRINPKGEARAQLAKRIVFQWYSNEKETFSVVPKFCSFSYLVGALSAALRDFFSGSIYQLEKIIVAALNHFSIYEKKSPRFLLISFDLALKSTTCLSSSYPEISFSQLLAFMLIGKNFHKKVKVVQDIENKILCAYQALNRLSVEWGRSQDGFVNKAYLYQRYCKHSFFSFVKYGIFSSGKELSEIMMILSHRASDHAGASRKVFDELQLPYLKIR